MGKFTDMPLSWEDLADQEEVGMAALARLRALNCRTVLALHALIDFPEVGVVSFEQETKLSATEITQRLQERHPDLTALPPPSERKYYTGFQKTQKDPGD